jgi:hypothetical protein
MELVIISFAVEATRNLPSVLAILQLRCRYRTATGDTILFDFRPSGVQGIYPTLLIYNSFGGVSQNLCYYTNGSIPIQRSISISSNTWHHIAVARASGVTRLFTNGNMDGSFSDTYNYLASTVAPVIGAEASGVSAFTGYIEDFRVTKGIACYTANFTPPNGPLPSK